MCCVFVGTQLLLSLSSLCSGFQVLFRTFTRKWSSFAYIYLPTLAAFRVCRDVFRGAWNYRSTHARSGRCHNGEHLRSLWMLLLLKAFHPWFSSFWMLCGDKGTQRRLAVVSIRPAGKPYASHAAFSKTLTRTLITRNRSTSVRSM